MCMDGQAIAISVAEGHSSDAAQVRLRINLTDQNLPSCYSVFSWTVSFPHTFLINDTRSLASLELKLVRT